MKQFKPRFDKDKIIYLCKCIMGVFICFQLYELLPRYPFNWSLVSVVLALSPDNSNEQAYNRIKANILGCSVGILLYLVHMPELSSLMAGVFITILIGFLLNLTTTVRTSLAAIVIVLLQADQGKHWEIVIERIICVFAGCVVALLLTLLFNCFLRLDRQKAFGK